MRKLTNAADRLACIMYKDYLDWRRAGMPKADAKEFGSSKSDSPAVTTLRSLRRCGLNHAGNWIERITCPYSTILMSCRGSRLSDIAIIYMGNRFRDGAVGVTKFLSHFIP